MLTTLPNSSGKTVALVEGYSFYVRTAGVTTTRWACTSSGKGRHCKAHITATKDNIILRVHLDHNHPPPYFTIKNALIFTKSNRGNPALQIGKYKFSLKTDKRRNNVGKKKRWVCNQRVSGCTAFVVTINREVFTWQNEHNH
ncbi:FLYWCH zinc finger domain-containing protein [Phthorimaea operculella]|nr:FLYWCH zinc finger domain-containing protein [Phthorimaea operculella]